MYLRSSADNANGTFRKCFQTSYSIIKSNGLSVAHPINDICLIFRNMSKQSTKQDVTCKKHSCYSKTNVLKFKKKNLLFFIKLINTQSIYSFLCFCFIVSK